MKRPAFVFVILMIAATLPGYAQKSEPAKPTPAAPLAQPGRDQQYFRLTFVVREVNENGKVVNSREYVTNAADSLSGLNASIRTGARVPISTGVGTQWQYIDVGVNFDVRQLHVLSQTSIGMKVDADLSSYDSSSEPTKSMPVIHQNKWSGDEQMTLGQPKVIFSSDDLTSKNKVQVELTVTKVK